MCSRYQFTMEDNPDLQRILQRIQQNFPQEEWTPGDIRPSEKAPVLVAQGARVVSRLYRWGFPRPGKGGLVINARAETVLQRPMFRASMEFRRCVVPTTGFFEWDSAKHPYLFWMPQAPVLYFAGLYDQFEGQDCFVILTTAANGSMQAVHDRMPLLLPREQIRPWLTNTELAFSLLGSTPPPLKATRMDGQLSLW